jgi:hypothetical protein
MAKPMKDPFQGLEIPEPSRDFEKRILAAGAKAMGSKNVVAFRPRTRSIWSRASAAAGLAACFAVLWLMPSPMDSRVHGLPILADISFGEEEFLSPADGDEPLEDLL